MFDFIVIGSGIAGLNFAINAAKYGKVAIITKKEIMESNTNYAQGGIAAVMDDDFESHIKDTIQAGAGLCDIEAVEMMVKAAPVEIKKLIEKGVGFYRDHGKFSLAREGGHSKRRILHAGDMTGRDIERTLIFHTRSEKKIQVFEEYIAIDLILSDNKCAGVHVLNIKNNKIDTFYSKAIILATGGLCQIYKFTSNPKIATGDGIAIAYRAGAEVSDLEFVQFHPTTLNKEGCPHFLISEAVRGEGGRLLNFENNEFIDPLLPRDQVARAIVSEMKKGRVFLDVRNKGALFIRNRFPTIYEKCYWYGIDMTKDLIPIGPAAHYCSGGIKTNLYGETNIKGLYAFGEVACTGVHGANRLASNSLLESLVFSTRALTKAIEYISNITPVINSKVRECSFNLNNLDMIKSIKKKFQLLMWQKVGIIRNARDLRYAINAINEMDVKIGRNKTVNSEIIELRNMILVGKLIATAALEREESRGGHYREDFPNAYKKWAKHILMKR